MVNEGLSQCCASPIQYLYIEGLTGEKKSRCGKCKTEMPSESKMKAILSDLKDRYTKRFNILYQKTPEVLREMLLGMEGIPMSHSEMVKQVLRKEFPAR